MRYGPHPRKHAGHDLSNKCRRTEVASAAFQDSPYLDCCVLSSLRSSRSPFAVRFTFLAMLGYNGLQLRCSPTSCDITVKQSAPL